MNNQPIGIFDSGIGGLTVAHAIKKILPNEDIIYFGDTEHLPYGEKSKKAIQNYSIKITQFLLHKKCKIIIIACNSASSLAYKSVKKTAKKILIVGGGNIGLNLAKFFLKDSQSNEGIPSSNILLRWLFLYGVKIV